MKSFPNLSEYSVLDLGGTADYWQRVPVRPRSVHLINLASAPNGAESRPDWMRVDFADACAIPSGVIDSSYDLVYSNSVIEHVGGHRMREAFIDQVRRAAPRYWVQTPYRYFPIEPHWVAPGMQFLPLRARSLMGRYWPLTHTKPSDLAGAVEEQLGVELLDITQMRHYFPEAELMYERIAGLVKSLIAVKRA
jgi:hypothetical protein